jgi:metal-sulfur cluster biosynthetic enzyme
MKEGEICYSTYSQGKSWSGEDPAWMTYFNRENGDGFATIRLEYECTHPHWSKPASVSIGGNLWVRYPLHNAIMRRGDFIREKNAYLIHKYEPLKENGFGMLMNYYKRLLSSPIQQETPITKKPLNISNVLDALRACYDAEVYLRRKLSWGERGLSVVDLGLIYDVKIANGNVHITMTMPYKGRETWFLWFTKMINEQIKQWIDGVAEVEVECVWGPAWSPDKMTRRAKKCLGLLTPALPG